MVVILISTLTVVTILKVLLHLRKYKRKHDISNNRNIQCADNSPYQETKYDCEAKNIICIENSAYSNVKHDHEVDNIQCLDSQECHSKQQCKADHDNSQHLENINYKECVLHVDLEAEAVNPPTD